MAEPPGRTTVAVLELGGDRIGSSRFCDQFRTSCATHCTTSARTLFCRMNSVGQGHRREETPSPLLFGCARSRLLDTDLTWRGRPVEHHQPF